MPNYTDTDKPQLTAEFFGIRRRGKSLAEWEVEVREVEFANVEDTDRDFRRGAGGFSFGVDAGKCGEDFAVVDPETLEPTRQTATYGQLFALIQSAYMHEARKRDELLKQCEV